MYSKQDLEKLNGNLKKIEEFCRQNYIPRIPRREDRICVDFGPLESYPDVYKRQEEEMYRAVQQPSRIHKPMVHEGELQAEVLTVLGITCLLYTSRGV